MAVKKPVKQPRRKASTPKNIQGMDWKQIAVAVFAFHFLSTFVNKIAMQFSATLGRYAGLAVPFAIYYLASNGYIKIPGLALVAQTYLVMEFKNMVLGSTITDAAPVTTQGYVRKTGKYLPKGKQEKSLSQQVKEMKRSF